MIPNAIIRKVAKEYLRNCEYGMGEEDCWLFAIETVEGKLTPEQLCALAAIVRDDEDPECEAER